MLNLLVTPPVPRMASAPWTTSRPLREWSCVAAGHDVDLPTLLLHERLGEVSRVALRVSGVPSVVVRW